MQRTNMAIGLLCAIAGAVGGTALWGLARFPGLQPTRSYLGSGAALAHDLTDVLFRTTAQGAYVAGAAFTLVAIGMVTARVAKPSSVGGSFLRGATVGFITPYLAGVTFAFLTGAYYTFRNGSVVDLAHLLATGGFALGVTSCLPSAIVSGTAAALSTGIPAFVTFFAIRPTWGALRVLPLLLVLVGGVVLLFSNPLLVILQVPAFLALILAAFVNPTRFTSLVLPVLTGSVGCYLLVSGLLMRHRGRQIVPSGPAEPPQFADTEGLEPVTDDLRQSGGIIRDLVSLHPDAYPRQLEAMLELRLGRVLTAQEVAMVAAIAHPEPAAEKWSPAVTSESPKPTGIFGDPIPVRDSMLGMPADAMSLVRQLGSHGSIVVGVCLVGVTVPLTALAHWNFDRLYPEFGPASGYLSARADTPSSQRGTASGSVRLWAPYGESVLGIQLGSVSTPSRKPFSLAIEEPRRELLVEKTDPFGCYCQWTVPFHRGGPVLLRINASEPWGVGFQTIPAATYSGANVTVASGELAAKWWQWVLAQPSSDNPLTDTTGVNCGTGQAAPVWLLAGNLGGTDVRECTVPLGLPMLLPIANYFTCNDPSVESVLRQNARVSRVLMADRWDLRGASIDGVSIKNVHGFHTNSAGFSVELPSDNIFGGPAITCPSASARGNFLLLSPLSVGLHSISFRAEPTISPSDFAVDVTYNVTVID